MPGPSYLDTVVQQVQMPEVRAFLDAIASSETPGFAQPYNTLAGGGQINDLDAFPQWNGIPSSVVPGAFSHGAGKYQFEPKTYRDAAARLGLVDPNAPTMGQGAAPFYPMYQDMVAWDNANQAFKSQHPKGDLLSTLQSGNVEQAFQAMRDSQQWIARNPQNYWTNLANNLTADAALPPTDRIAGGQSTDVAAIPPSALEQLAAIPQTGGP